MEINKKVKIDNKSVFCCHLMGLMFGDYEHFCLIQPEIEVPILLNCRFKTENNLELTDLEKIIGQEAGNFIREIVDKAYQDKHYTSLPFPELGNLTITQLNNLNFLKSRLSV